MMKRNKEELEDKLDKYKSRKWEMGQENQDLWINVQLIFILWNI